MSSPSPNTGFESPESGSSVISFEQLVELSSPPLYGFISRKLSPRMASGGDANDVLNGVILEALNTFIRNGTFDKLSPKDAALFFHIAKQRMIDLGVRSGPPHVPFPDNDCLTFPSSETNAQDAVDHAEWTSLLNQAIQQLPSELRDIISMKHDVRKMTFEAISEELKLSKTAVHNHYKRGKMLVAAILERKLGGYP